MRNLSKHQKNNVIIGGLLFIVLLMAIGYAAFASKLNISGTSNITSNWDIEITNIESNNLGSTAYDISAPTYTSNSATFNTGFKRPGDEMIYEIEISNKGSLDGQISVTDLDCGGNDAIYCYALHSNEKAVGDYWDDFESDYWDDFDEGSYDLTEQAITIKQGEKKYLYIGVGFDESVSSMPDNLTSNIKLTLDFIQKEIVPIESGPIMMARNDSKAFWRSTYSSKISTVDVLTNKDVPSNAVKSWDVSKGQNGTVMAWIVDDSDNSGMYKLYIGGEGGVIAPSDSSYLFAVDVINGSVSSTFSKTISLNLKNLNTENTTNMSYMFAYIDYNGSNLSSLDISGFDTSKVTNMSNMFYNCSGLTNLDVSNFDTSNVLDMSSMFSCLRLTSLNLCSFDTSNVTEMHDMFYNTFKLTAIYVGPSWTTANATTDDMFSSSRVSAVTTGQC